MLRGSGFGKRALTHCSAVHFRNERWLSVSGRQADRACANQDQEEEKGCGADQEERKEERIASCAVAWWGEESRGRGVELELEGKGRGEGKEGRREGGKKGRRRRGDVK